MAKQSIGLGSVADDGTGDTLRIAGDKVNDNFDEIYTALGDGSTLTSVAVTAINNATANELVTIGATTTELDAEANLTFDGSTLAVTGNITIPNDGNIGSVSDTNAISIASGGDVTFTQDILIAAGGSRTSSGQTENIIITNSNSAGDDTGIHMTAGNTGNSTIRFGAPGDDTLSSIQATNNTTSATLKLAAGNGNTNLTLSGTSGSELAVFAGDIRIKDGGNIGSASDTDSMAIASTGIVTFSQIPALPVNSIEISTTTRGAFLVIEAGGTDGAGANAGDNIIDETDSDDIIHESATDLVGSVFNIIDSAGMVVRTINSV